MLIVFSINANAQTIGNHYITGNVGVGTTIAPTDASLHIFSNQTCSIVNPEIKISRTYTTAILGGGFCSPNVNFMEIWSPHFSLSGPLAILDVINKDGYFGILKSNPTEPLDVDGNALIEQDLTVTKNGSVGKDLTVQDNLSVGSSATPNDASLHIYNNLTCAIQNPAIKISRTYYTGILGGTFCPTNANFMEIWSPHLSTAGIPSGPLTIFDVINKEGWLGILKAIPTEPLDVNGNALIEQNLAVHGYAVIGNYSTATSTALALPTSGVGTEYSLYVANGILTEQVRVALNGSSEWADYVFAKNYKLMPLNKVADYIKENKHLPDVPAADDVKKEGIDLGSMDAKLLKKIEELTLYAIQQQKQIDELQKKIDELDAQTKN